MNLLFHPNKKVQAHSISSERDETYPELKFKNLQNPIHGRMVRSWLYLNIFYINYILLLNPVVSSVGSKLKVGGGGKTCQKS